MTSTLDRLEARRDEAIREYTALVGDPGCCAKVDLQVGWLEKKLEKIYQYTLKQTKKDLTPRQIADLWTKTGQICDFFIDLVRSMASQSNCPVTYDNLLDVRLAANEKADFHRCGQ